MARKATDEVQLKLRFKEKLRQRIEREAAKNDRSMNAEIIHRLEYSFTVQDVFAQAKKGTERALAEYEKRRADFEKRELGDEQFKRFISFLNQRFSNEEFPYSTEELTRRWYDRMRSIRALIREKWGSESVELRDINTLITSVDEARLAEREKGRLLEQHKGE